MNLSQLLKELYVREINVTIESFFDSGWSVKFGDKINGYDPGKTIYRDTVTEMEVALNAFLKTLPPLTENDLRYIEK